MFKEKLAVVIPTKDRPKELNRLFESICKQEVLPNQTIVIDGGKADSDNILKKFSHLNIDYAKINIASLTTQRNLGITFLKPDISLVCFFDDDITLEKNSLSNMLKFWENATEDVAGATFNNMNHAFRNPTFFERVFLVKAGKPGGVLRSGFQGLPCSLKETTQVDWLIGCSMVFRRKIFDEFKFDEWFDGYAHCEDVDFCYRVGKKYKLYAVADAKIYHFNTLEKIENSFALGRMQIVNRVYFVKKNSGLSVLFCYWACLGIFLNNIVRSLLDYDKRHYLRAKGNLAGFFDVFRNKTPQAPNVESTFYKRLYG